MERSKEQNKMAIEVIRVQTQQQLEECLKIRKQVFVVEQKVPENREIDQYDHLPNDGVAYHFLLQKDGESIAAGRMIRYENGAAKMQRIAVLPGYRRGGYGKSILLGMENYARQNGFEKALLDSQCQAEGFYNKMGYITISEEPFDDAGIAHVSMKKQLVVTI